MDDFVVIGGGIGGAYFATEEILARFSGSVHLLQRGSKKISREL